MPPKIDEPGRQVPHKPTPRTGVGDLVGSFDALALAEHPRYQPEHFIGGFSVGRANQDVNQSKKSQNGGFAKKLFAFGRRKEDHSSLLSSPSRTQTPVSVQQVNPSVPFSMNVQPLPMPPAMPVPRVDTRMSLPMYYAQSAPDTSLAPGSRPNLAPRPNSGPTITTTSPNRLHPDAALQGAPHRPRASSAPESSSSSTPSSKSASDHTQCSGTTKKGERCTRLVRAPPLSQLNPEASVERFCHQHTPEILKPTGFYSRNGKSEWVDFDNWIPIYLQSDTKAALRAEMEKPHSSSDVPGYVYTFEIRDPKTPGILLLKVGRAVNLNKRLSEWDKQCGSKEQVLRGYYPCTVEEDENSVLKARIKPGEKGPYCHRLERLIHLELADLSLYAAYLSSGYPNIDPPSRNVNVKGQSSGSSTPNRGGKRSPASSPSGDRVAGKPCPDCGKVHKEIFAFVRPKSGNYKDKEWELIVDQVIRKWGRFVELHV